MKTWKNGDVMNATNLNGAFAGIYNDIYPAGSIYKTIDTTNPSTLFGGTWEQIENRDLIATGTITDANGAGTGWYKIYSNGDFEANFLGASHTLTKYNDIYIPMNSVKVTSAIITSGFSWGGEYWAEAQNVSYLDSVNNRFVISEYNSGDNAIQNLQSNFIASGKVDNAIKYGEPIYAWRRIA